MTNYLLIILIISSSLWFYDKNPITIKNEKTFLTFKGYSSVTEYFAVESIYGTEKLCYSEKNKFNICNDNTIENKLVLIGKDQLHSFQSPNATTNDLIFHKWITQRKFLRLNSIKNDTLSSRTQVRFNSDWITELIQIKTVSSQIISDCHISENENVFFNKKEKYEVSAKKYQKIMLYLKKTNCLDPIKEKYRFIPRLELISGNHPWKIKSINIDKYTKKMIKNFKLISKDENFIYELLKTDNFRQYAKLLGIRKKQINKIISKKENYQSSEEIDFIKNTNIDQFQYKHNIPKLKIKKQIVVAIIDTGINTNIPNIQSKIYNPENIPNFYGYDFSNSLDGIHDTSGHGTNVSGIILGVNPHVKILPLKYYNRSVSGSENLRNELNAMRKAIDLNVDIINYSAGGPQASSEEKELIQLAKNRGIILVNALGNEEKNLDDNRSNFFPASYNLENQISVANLKEESSCREYNCLSASSNYSERMDSVSFEGEQISAFGVTMTGTSQATPFITGAISLYLANNEKRPSINEIKSIIDRSSIKNKKYKSKYGRFSFEKFAFEVSGSRSIANNP